MTDEKQEKREFIAENINRHWQQECVLFFCFAAHDVRGLWACRV